MSASDAEDLAIRPGIVPSAWRPARRIIAASAVMMAIFLIDVLAPLQGAIAVLHVVVLVLVFGAVGAQGVTAMAAACVGLTLGAHFLDYGLDGSSSSLLRCLVSLAAILTTAWLLVRHQGSIDALERQASIIDLTHDAIILKRMDGRISSWNRGAETMYGWTAHDVLGRPLGEVLRTLFPGGRDAAVEHLLRSGRWDGEVTQVASDGRRIIANCRWALLRDSHGTATGIIETSTDITERRAAEDALAATQAALAHAGRVATVSTLTATLAHEINQPLAAIVTNTNAALRWLRRPEPNLFEIEAALERTRASGERAAAIVNQARTFLTRRDAPAESVDPDAVIREALLLVERELREHGVALQLDLPEGLPRIRTDRVQLQQVVVNLVLNAAQALAEVPEARRRLAIRATRDGDGGLRVAVQDQGPGLAPDLLPHLFTPFSSKRQGGMGLGLAICRTIIEAGGGRLWAESEPGQGASFHFTLPTAPEGASP
jgi:PAS domain S-box-containing protein